MTLPVYPSKISMSQINTELGLSSTAKITLNNTVVRNLLAKPTNQSKISMYDAYGKSNVKVTYTGFAAETVVGTVKVITFFGSGTLTVSGGSVTVQASIVGGGAGGDYRYNSGGGGGGGGGVTSPYITLASGTYPVVVGGGGTGQGTTLAGATGSTSSFAGYNATGGLPSGYNSGYDYGRGGTPNGANGGAIANGTGSNGPYSLNNGPDLIRGSGGGAGGTSGGAGGIRAGNGGGSYQAGTNAEANGGGGGGGGGWYLGSTYYYGGFGGSGTVVVKGVWG